MRYSGLMRLGKKGFCINFTLFDKLKITTKEAILLQQIEFVNKRSDFFVIPLTILSKITNMSRGHLYRCLNKLKKLDLIVVTDDGIAVTDYYREIKEQDFAQNHKQALSKSKKSQSVACEAKFDEFAYTKYQCDENVESEGGSAESKLENNSNNNKNIAKNIQAEQNDENAKETQGNTQKSKYFFMTKTSQNETNLSQNETDIYNKENNNISLCDISHKEYIYYPLQEEATNKKQGLIDSLAFLLANLKNKSTNKETLDLNGQTFKELVSEFQHKVQKQQKMSANELLSKFGSEVQKKALDFMLELNGKTLIFLNIEAKKAFFSDLEALVNNGRFFKAVEYSTKNKCLWLCEGNDSKGRKFLKDLYLDMQKELDKKDKKAHLERVKSMSKEQILSEVMNRYSEKIKD